MAKPSYLSLFAGAGGLDYGLEAAGFELVLAVERDETCCETLRANRRWPVLNRDLGEVEPREILSAAGLRQRSLDLLAAGPPCQPFSKSANWSPTGPRGLDDPRASSLNRMMDIVQTALPRCVLIENVEGFRQSGPASGLEFVLRRFKAINRNCGTRYSPHWRILNATDYGVPQTRKRFFLVAFRNGAAFTFPESSASAPVTAWQAIGDLQDRDRPHLAAKGRWSELLGSIPEGKNYLWHTNRGGGQPLFGWRTRYWSFLLKLAKNAPAWTISAQPAQNAGPFHWHNRQLSTSELLRLQTFPAGTFIAGDRTARQRQIGNAVPSLLAEAIGRSIQVQLGGRVRRKFVLALPPKPGPTPEAEPVQSVQPRYLRLIGQHDDHPGTGLGPRGRRAQAEGTVRSP